MIDTLTLDGLPIFDVQVDGNHLFEESKTQICAYSLFINDAGDTEADTREPVFSVTVPSLGYADDSWSQSNEVEMDWGTWPVHIRRAFDYVTLSATDRFFEEHGEDPRFHVGDTVFLPEFKMPGRVVSLTDDGRHVVDMGDSGVIDVFMADELAKYQPELWQAP